jgi:hypothetical protein
MAAPTFTSALTSQDGLTVEILLGGSGVTSIIPATGAITGWTLVQDPAGSATTIPITTAYRKGSSGADALTVVLTLQTRLTALSVLKLSYSSGTGNITDQTAAFPMATYAGSNSNCVNYTGRPVFLSAATSLDGQFIDIVFNDYDSTSILPSNQGIPGFIVKVGGSGGTSQTFPNPIRKGDSGSDLKTVRITLTTPLLYTDSNIVVKYTPDVSVFITDNSAPPVPTLAFDYQSVTQNTIERIAPAFASAHTSTDGYSVYVVFTETGPPSPGKILPESINIAGFTITEDVGAGYVTRNQVSAIRSTDTMDANYLRTIIITLNTPLTYNKVYKIAYANVTGKPKVTDGATIPNNLLAFTSSPVTNTTTYERILPVFLSATTSSTNLVLVNFTEANSVPLAPTSPSGFILRANGANIPFSITRTSNTQYTLTRTDYKTWGAEDYITVEYVQPTSNFVTDAAPASNKLASFGPNVVTNAIVNNTSAPLFVRAATNVTGNSIVVYIRENHSFPPYINPSTGITGFYVTVNGVPRDIISAVRGNTITTFTDVNRTINLALAYPVRAKDLIKLNYYNGNVVDVDTDSSPNNLGNFSSLVENTTAAKIFGTNVAFATFDSDEIFRTQQFDILRSYGIQWIRDYQVDGQVDTNPGTQTVNRAHAVVVARQALDLDITPSIVLADSNYGIENSDGVNFTAANFNAFKHRFADPAEKSDVRRAMLCAAIAGNLTTVLTWVLNDVSALNELFPYGTVGEEFNGPRLYEWRYLAPNGGCSWDAFERVLSGTRGAVVFNVSGNVTSGSALPTSTDFATFCAALPVPINFTAVSESTLRSRFESFRASLATRWTKGGTLGKSVLVENDDSSTLEIGDSSSRVVTAFNYKRYDSISGDPVVNRGAKQIALAQTLYNANYHTVLLDEWTERTIDITFTLGSGKTMPLWTAGTAAGSYYALLANDVTNYGNLSASHLCIDQTDCDAAMHSISQLFELTQASNDLSSIPFNPLHWILSGSSSMDSRTGYLLERRLGWPLASTILDTTPPIGSLVINESPGSGGIKVHHFAAYGSTTLSNGGGGQDDLNNKYEATQLLSSGAFDITAISLNFKKGGTITNQSERITVSLYSDSGDKPLQQLATSSDFVSYGDLTTSFQAFEFKLDYRLEDNTKYWIVVFRSAAPLGTSAFIYISTKSPAAGEYAISSDASSWTLETGKSFQYSFTASDASAQPQSAINELQDALEIPIYDTVTFGGSDDETIYELIGVGDRRYIVMRINQVTENNVLVYPAISSVEVGLTADKPKSYLIEAKVNPTDAWTSLFTMIADNESREYFRYTFSSPVRLSDIRLSYRGDFYTSSNDGTITVSGTDPLTSVTAFQASHYTDFHDAISFPNADSDGWVPFTDGISLFDWKMINDSETWLKQAGNSLAGPLSNATIFGGFIVAHDHTTLYTFSASGTLTSRKTITSGQEPILSIAVHKNVLYVGLENGQLLSSSDAKIYSTVPISTITAPIRALVSYRSKLWIGTGRDTDNLSKIYTWDSTSLILIRTLVQPQINAFAVAHGKLFVGAGSDSGVQAASVYYYDGQQWSLTFSAQSVGVDALTFSTADSRLWAGLEGGSVYALTFKETGDLDTWKQAYDGDATHYISISDDPNGDYVWLCSDTGLVVYNKSTLTFASVPLPTPESGLQSVWTNSDAANYLTIGSGTRKIYYNDDQINWADFSASRPSNVNATYFNTSWEEYITPSQTANWKFFSNTTLGVSRLYINDELIIDEVTTPAVTTGWAQLTEGKYYKFRYEYFKDGSSGGSAVLNWQANGTGGITNVSKPYFGKPNEITKISYIGAAPYAMSSSGNIYLLDTSAIATKKRTAYVRFKDEAGNTTTLPGLSDTIIQDSPTRNGVRISDGNIYQINTNDKRVLATFASPISGALKSPKRKTREDGSYESEPFYSPTLTRWDKISFLAVMPAGTYQEEGLDIGVEVTLQVRSGKTREECLAATWGNDMTYSTIIDPGIAGTVDTALNGDFSIAGISDKWIQYKAILVTATRGTTPELKAVVLSYLAAHASYFFTTLLDTSAESESPYPQFRRGLLTANMAPNGGAIKFGYTTETVSPTTFNFSNYTEITPNTVFELPSPSQYLRFGILFVSVMSDAAPTKLYPKTACVVATTQVLPSTLAIVYNNGAAGVGATLTRGENGVLGAIDGVTLSVNDRLLVKDQANAIQNGLYKVTNVGSGGAPYVLTRVTDADQAATEMRYGLYTTITSGTTNGTKNYFMKTADVIVMGTSLLSFTEFTPAIVDEFGVQLDAGTADMKFMD